MEIKKASYERQTLRPFNKTNNMANIPKSYQFPNGIVDSLAQSNPLACAVLVQIIFELKRPHKDDTDEITDRLCVDCSFFKKRNDSNKMRTVQRHLDYLVDSHIIKRIGTRKSWIYALNPLVYNKLRKVQREYYAEHFAEIHMFNYISIL